LANVCRLLSGERVATMEEFKLKCHAG
jgi:hypothetical protein